MQGGLKNSPSRCGLFASDVLFLLHELSKLPADCRRQRPSAIFEGVPGSFGLFHAENRLGRANSWWFQPLAGL